MNSILRASFVNRINSALAEARTYASINHMGVRGRLREILVEELIRPLLPPIWEIATGVLVDHKGDDSSGQSGQEDILIFSRDLIPAGIRVAETGILPIEACLGVIEVKSTLNSSTLNSAINHSRTIASLSTIYERFSKKKVLSWQHRLASRPLYSLFALGSDLRSGPEAEWKRIKAKHSERGLEQPALFGVCCAGMGTALWYGENPPLEPRRSQNADGENSEIIGFFSFLSDYLRRIEQIKKTELPMPAISHYLLPES